MKCLQPFRYLPTVNFCFPTWKYQVYNETNRCHQRIYQRNKSTIPKFSYLHEIGSRVLTEYTVGNFIDISAEKFADREAIVDWVHKIRWNFPKMKEEVDRLATGFLKLNLEQGDRIGIWSPNRYEWMLTQFAAAKCGLILVTLNSAYQASELEYCMTKVGLRAIVTPDKFKTQEYYNILTQIVPEIPQAKSGMNIKSKKLPNFDTLIVMSDENLPGAFKFNEVWGSGGSEEKSRLEKLNSKITFDDIACIKFTSGTTGKPKGVMLSHHNIVNGGYSTVVTKFDAENQRHRVCVTVPFFHVFGCITTIINNLITGAATVIPLPIFHSPTIMQCLEKEKCTVLMGTPTMYIDLLNSLEANPVDVSSLKLGIISGAPISPSLMEKLMTKFKCQAFCGGYGSTELSGGTFDSHPDDPLEDKITTAGHLHYYTEAKIVDSEGRVVPVGTPGEIWIRGYKVMKGYWDDEAETKKAITIDGWYKTKDVGVFNENRSLTVIERINDMIIRGGENIYPREIEDFFNTHPKIVESQVIGVPDERLGEAVCVWIRLKENETMSEAEVIEFCKGKISFSKIPLYVKFTKDFPRTLSGKVKKYELRKMMST